MIKSIFTIVMFAIKTKTVHLALALLVLLAACTSPKDREEEEGAPDIRVETKTVTLSRQENPIGINLNYLRDTDALREDDAAPLLTALKEFNGNWLRYPGGKKSNYYRFALPPYQHVDPQTSGWYLTERKSDVLDFEEYMDLVAKAHANAYVVVAYDRERINDRTATLQEYIDHAVGWVNYAETNKSGVVYWEIGNENWNNFKGSSWKQVVQDIATIAQAMKNADPTIKLGANFDNEEQLRELLQDAGTYLDFISCSNYYPGTKWGDTGYLFYENSNHVNTLLLYDTFLKVSQQLGVKKEFVIAECNSKEWEGNWTDKNDIGHALVCFDMCTQINQHPEITSGIFWNTSWFDNENNVFNLLDNKNQLRSNAQAVKLWNNFWKKHVVKTVNTLGLVTYAVKDDAGNLTVFIINKGGVEKKGTIQVDRIATYQNNKTHRFSSASGKDSGTLTGIADAGSTEFDAQGFSEMSFFPYSITVLDFKQKRIQI